MLLFLFTFSKYAYEFCESISGLHKFFPGMFKPVRIPVTSLSAKPGLVLLAVRGRKIKGG